MNNEKSLDIEIIKSAFLKYNLGFIKGEPEKIKGDVDLNYKITTEQNEIYLLKYIVNLEHIQKFEFLGSVYGYLKSKEIPVPVVFKTKNGSFVEDSFILYGYIDGETKTDWNNEEIISLVNNFAKLLVNLKNYDVPDFVKNNNDKYNKGYNIKYCHDIFKPEILKLDMPKEIKDSILKIIDLLYGKLSDFEKLSKQLVHGDLNEMNAIFKDGINTGIIDFGVGYDPLIYDLGEFCYWFALPWGTARFNRERYDLIIQTFEKILSLTVPEKELLPYMVLRRHMMDIMLALQYYWSNKDNMLIPIKTLSEKIDRSKALFEALSLS